MSVTGAETVITAFAYRAGGKAQPAFAAPCQSEAFGNARKIVSFVPETHTFRPTYLSDSWIGFAIYPINYSRKPVSFFGARESHFGKEPVNARCAAYMNGPERFSGISWDAEVLSPLYLEGSEVAAGSFQQAPIGVGDFQAVDRMCFTGSGANSMCVFTKEDRSFSIKESTQPSGHEVLGLLSHQDDFINLQPVLGGL